MGASSRGAADRDARRDGPSGRGAPSPGAAGGDAGQGRSSDRGTPPSGTARMMATAVPWQAGAAAARAGGSPVDAARSGPVIVLTYAHAGARRLGALLADRPELVCTSGTGLLPACDLAASAWRQAERGRDGAMSALAASSVRAMATGMITAIVARAGRPRWCETVAADRGAAETFLRLFPAARFVCLHRACPDVVYAALRANPWGISGPGYAAYTAAYPGSTVAALAAWWAAQAGSALAFEEAHPGECLRVRYEDLVEDAGSTGAHLGDFLGLAGGFAVPGAAPDAGAERGPAGPEGADVPGCGAGLPAAQLPAPLLAQVNAAHARLGYPPLRPEPR